MLSILFLSRSGDVWLTQSPAGEVDTELRDRIHTVLVHLNQLDHCLIPQEDAVKCLFFCIVTAFVQLCKHSFGASGLPIWAEIYMQ